MFICACSISSLANFFKITLLKKVKITIFFLSFLLESLSYAELVHAALNSELSMEMNRAKVKQGLIQSCIKKWCGWGLIWDVNLL